MHRAVEIIKKQWPRWSCYILYTIAFIPVALFLTGIFRDAGMNFIRQNDGVSQHFNALLYLEKYLRAAAGMLKGRGMSAPLMNYTIGQGSDIITTMNGYDFFNPVSVLAVLLFRKDMFRAYEFMILADLYLAGACFCVYCRTVGRREGWSVASGALIYAFCGYALNFSTRHPLFMNGMYMLPLLLAGAEVLIKKKKCLPLILAVFFSVMINYFSFYMNMVCFAGYLLLRFFPCRRERIKPGALMILKVAGVTAAGGLLSMVWLLPAAFGTVLNNGGYQKIAGYTESMWLYPTEYYRRLAEYFVCCADEIDYKNYLGFAPIALICILVLFMQRRRELDRLRAAFVLSLAGMCIPLVGLAMNGFRYVNNRWTYAFAFVVAFVFVETAKDLPKLTFRQLLVILSVMAGLVFLWFTDEDFNQMKYVPVMLLVLTVVTVCFCGRPYIRKSLILPGFMVLIVLSSVAGITMLYSRDYGGYVYTFCNAAEGYGIYSKYSSARVANSADDEDFYRSEMMEERENTEGYNNVRGTTYYFSAIDSSYQQYYSDMQLSSRPTRVQAMGLSGCTALLDLASVKYFTLPSQDYESYVPYGYQEAGDCVYENTHYLPPAFLYKSCISYEDFLDRNPADRQRAMLQGAVLSEPTDFVEEVKAEPRVREVEYTLSGGGSAQTPGILLAGDKDESVTVSFEPQPGCELYLWLDGVVLDSAREYSSITASGGYMTEDGIDRQVIKSVLLSTPQYIYYVPREGVCFNLGYSEKGYDCCNISIEAGSNFTYTGLHILANPMDTYDDDIAGLRDAACDDITIAKDRIYGTVTCDENSILQLSVPYSVGWRAYVDGSRVKVLRSNIMYTGLELGPGTHEVELRYRTPYLVPGAVISLLTLAAMVVVGFGKARRKNQNGRGRL